MIRRPGARGLDVGPEPVDGHDRPRLAALEDLGLELGVQGGVEGHGHGADREGAEEGEEELLARRQDDRHLVARPEARARGGRRHSGGPSRRDVAAVSGVPKSVK